MIGIGTPKNQSNIPRPMAVHFRFMSQSADGASGSAILRAAARHGKAAHRLSSFRAYRRRPPVNTL